MALNQRELEAEVIEDTLGLMLKYQDDIEQSAAVSPCGRCWSAPATGAHGAAGRR